MVLCRNVPGVSADLDLFKATRGQGLWTVGLFCVRKHSAAVVQLLRGRHSSSLLLDFILFHRALAIKNIKPLLLSAVFIALSFMPLIVIVLKNVSDHAMGIAFTLGWKGAIADIGYPVSPSSAPLPSLRGFCP